MKKIVGVLAILAIIAGIIGFQKYQAYWSPNVRSNLENNTLEIPTGSSFSEVVYLLDSNGFLKDTSSFMEVAHQLSYVKPTMRSGRYKIQENWNNLSLVRHLRNGKQETIKLILTNARLPEEIAGKAASFIECDSLDIWELFQDENYLKKIGYTPETITSLFIPNTYDFFWNTSAEGFVERMVKENEKFWSKENRREKAAALKMTPAEVYTLASIVEKESNYNPEKPRIAGVYLNRIRIGMPLQADPTSVFARRDFTTKRVTDYHTTFDNPYNTYVYTGLPPGPIAMASISSLDAVLNHENHKYLYFCALGDGSGTHAFAKTLTQHNRNASIYRQNLRNRGRR